MLDYRIQTFLTLYQTMNYRQTAQQLNMTQPTVTQHIHALEQSYHCRLFYYDGHRLHRTPEAEQLAFYARASVYNEQEFRRAISSNQPAPIRLGATKTIGEFVIGDLLAACLMDSQAGLSLTVDNTSKLLALLEQGELDFAILEGNFDKSRYGYQLLRREPFIGICAKDHPLAGQQVPLESLFDQTLILREPGSGTRAIFEQVLHDFSYTPANFQRTVCISHFGVICDLVARGIGISFVYQAVADAKPDLACFTLQELPVVREFNYVYLSDAAASGPMRRFRRYETLLRQRK